MPSLSAPDGTRLFSSLGKGLSAENGELGVFLSADLAEPTDHQQMRLGRPVLPGKRPRWVAQHRRLPWWIEVAYGSDCAAVPVETQLWFARQADGRALLIAPLIDPDAGWRCALRGGKKGLDLVLDTGDATERVTAGLVAYVAVLDPNEPQQWNAAAAEVAARLGSVRLRQDKSLPQLVDAFGWCTWDAFYKEVSHDLVRAGLASFAECGIMPRWLILDDGWQPVRAGATIKDEALTDFDSNEKFPDGLAGTVAMAKDEFGLEQFLVWHAFQGYWGGVAGEAMPAYGVHDQLIAFAPDMAEVFDIEAAHAWFVKQVGVIDAQHIHRFYQDYHRELATAGIDGVKVDNQSSLEGLAVGQGGRVRQMARWREALEGSTQVQFGGELINCMSCSTDALYQTRASNLTRSSNDFFPERPETHAQHIIVNSQFGQWFGHFVHPDWDMFHSRHPWAHFHAVGRAVSGGPIYVSDKPGKQDAELLRALIFDDGSVARCDGPGTPSPASLFVDPVGDKELYKIGNRQGEAAVVGVFNCLMPDEGGSKAKKKAGKGKTGKAKVLQTRVGLADVAGLRAEDLPEEIALYAQGSGEFVIGDRDSGIDVELAPGTAELVSILPVHDGQFVPIGLIDKLNVAGSIDRRSSGWADEQRYLLSLRGGGRFLAWAPQSPRRMLHLGESLDFHFDAESGGVSVTVPPSPDGPALLVVCF